MSATRLRGMTWDHPRGVAPLLAASERWLAETGTAITWERRSLQDFESYPVEELARRYDLIVIDHPHVGQVADARCLVPLDALLPEAALLDAAEGSVGRSYESYRWAGHQWALPIDAAAQVQAWVPGRVTGPVERVDALPALLRANTALIPLRAPHALMTLFTLCGLGGTVLDVEAPALFPPSAARAYDLLAALADVEDPAGWSMDPIAVLEAMAEPASKIAAAPFVYGYVSYAGSASPGACLRFADLPRLGNTPLGSALGGTGIAVSSFGADPEGAARFAAWVASGAIQRDLVGRCGGQPAHALAWEDDGVNGLTGDFYRATRRTLDHAWLRPRHAGYMAFQHAASERLEEALRSRQAAPDVLAALNRLYGEHR